MGAFSTWSAVSQVVTQWLRARIGYRLQESSSIESIFTRHWHPQHGQHVALPWIMCLQYTPVEASVRWTRSGSVGSNRSREEVALLAARLGLYDHELAHRQRRNRRWIVCRHQHRRHGCAGGAQRILPRRWPPQEVGDMGRTVRWQR